MRQACEQYWRSLRPALRRNQRPHFGAGQRAKAKAGQSVSYTYAYDYLNRLTSAGASGGQTWVQPYEYDGYGNRTRIGQAYTGYDTATNRVLAGNGYTYDANGNVTGGPGGAVYTYDVANRLRTAGGEEYAYDARNQRICKSASCNAMTFYGAYGERLGVYTPVMYSTITFQAAGTDLYFDGKAVKQQGQWVAVDRMGSVRANGGGEAFRYYPYGEEYTATGQGRNKFGTYLRDGTGVDYANQRYYSSITGRFLTPDPSMASGGPGDSQSWNRYAYVQGDPVNFTDA